MRIPIWLSNKLDLTALPMRFFDRECFQLVVGEWSPDGSSNVFSKILCSVICGLVAAFDLGDASDGT
jgi:hypothetical protein